MGAGSTAGKTQSAGHALRRGGCVGPVTSSRRKPNPLSLNANVLHRWKRERREHGVKAFTGHGKMREEESRVAELERKIGRQAMENDFLRRCLQYAEEQRRVQALTTRGSSIRTSRKK